MQLRAASLVNHSQDSHFWILHAIFHILSTINGIGNTHTRPRPPPAGFPPISVTHDFPCNNSVLLRVPHLSFQSVLFSSPFFTTVTSINLLGRFTGKAEGKRGQNSTNCFMLILISAFVGCINSHTQNQLGQCQRKHLALPDSGSVLKRHSGGVKLGTQFSQSITHSRSPFQSWGKSSKLAQKRGNSYRCMHPLRSFITQVPLRSICNSLRPRILWRLPLCCLAFPPRFWELCTPLQFYHHPCSEYLCRLHNGSTGG